jgi:hypothetical protein
MTSQIFRTRLTRSISRLIGWFFGTFWALLGSFALPRPFVCTGCAFALVIALIFLVRLWRYEPPTPAARPLFRTPANVIAVSAELLGMYMAALLLPRFGAQQQVHSAKGDILCIYRILRSLEVGQLENFFTHKYALPLYVRID